MDSKFSSQLLRGNIDFCWPVSIRLLSREPEVLNERFVQLADVSTRTGLTANGGKKPKHVLVHRQERQKQSLLEVASYNFERVSNMGCLITEKKTSLEIGANLTQGTGATSLSSAYLARILYQKNAKKNKKNCPPTSSIYADETCVLAKRDEKKNNNGEDKRMDFFGT